jgi:hypothetical protein
MTSASRQEMKSVRALCAAFIQVLEELANTLTKIIHIGNVHVTALKSPDKSQGALTRSAGGHVVVPKRTISGIQSNCA